MADDPPAIRHPGPPPHGMTVVDQAFANLSAVLICFEQDRRDREFITGLVFDLLAHVNRDHPQIGPLAAAIAAMRDPDQGTRVFALTRLSGALADFFRWRGLAACAAAQAQGFLPEEGPWTTRD